MTSTATRMLIVMVTRFLTSFDRCLLDFWSTSPADFLDFFGVSIPESVSGNIETGKSPFLGRKHLVSRRFSKPPALQCPDLCGHVQRWVAAGELLPGARDGVQVPNPLEMP